MIKANKYDFTSTAYTVILEANVWNTFKAEDWST